MSKELLRKSALFSGLTDDDLEWVYSSARRIVLAPGDVIMTEGEAADAAYLTVAGALEVTRRTGDREFVIDRRVAGDFIGESALLENARRTATVRASTPAELLEVTRETFQELLKKCPDAALAVLQTFASRLRHTEITLRQSEKMAALGTLSAGLAHGDGVIRLRTSAGADLSAAPAVVMEIIDNGPGIPDSVKERMFDAFFTTKEPGHGTGLGLHISYNIVVNQHRGEIEVESKPGETTFRVTLPIHLRDD